MVLGKISVGYHWAFLRKASQSPLTLYQQNHQRSLIMINRKAKTMRHTTRKNTLNVISIILAVMLPMNWVTRSAGDTKTHAGQKSPKAMKRDRAITLFFLILRLSPDSVSEKSFGNPRHVANTHNSRPHLASGRYGSDRRSSD